MKKCVLPLFIVCLFFVSQLKAQFPTITIAEYQKIYHDSLKRVNYTNFFPILGKGAYKKGIDIPYPYGVMPVYFYQRQEYKIDNIYIAFDDNELTKIDGIKFGTIEGITNAVNVRPDVWIFPFLNVYGLIGYASTATSVQVIKPDISTVQHFNGVNYGLGTTLAGVLGPVLLTFDANFSWADFKELNQPVPITNISLRLGHTFNFLDRVDKNIAVWMGPFYQNVKSYTEGELDLSVIFGDKSAETQQKINEWYNGLGPVEQAKMEGLYNDITQALGTSHTVHYKLDKQIVENWNLVFGFQYQHNKRWQFRSEIGTFGKRTQFMLSANYRFL